MASLRSGEGLPASADERQTSRASPARRIVKVALIVGGLVLLGGAALRVCDVYRAFNARAASSEGKAWSRCLAADGALACDWEGWVSREALDRLCPTHPCALTTGSRYALHRVRLGDGRVGVVARCVRAYPLGDTWLGVGGEAVHCVDMTWESTSRRSDDGRGIRAADPRCAVVDRLEAP